MCIIVYMCILVCTCVYIYVHIYMYMVVHETCEDGPMQSMSTGLLRELCMRQPSLCRSAASPEQRVTSLPACWILWYGV